MAEEGRGVSGAEEPEEFARFCCLFAVTRDCCELIRLSFAGEVGERELGLVVVLGMCGMLGVLLGVGNCRLFCFAVRVGDVEAGESRWVLASCFACLLAARGCCEVPFGFLCSRIV